MGEYTVPAIRWRCIPEKHNLSKKTCSGTKFTIGSSGIKGAYVPMGTFLVNFPTKMWIKCQASYSIVQYSYIIKLIQMKNKAHSTLYNYN